MGRAAYLRPGGGPLRLRSGPGCKNGARAPLPSRPRRGAAARVASPRRRRRRPAPARAARAARSSRTSSPRARRRDRRRPRDGRVVFAQNADLPLRRPRTRSSRSRTPRSSSSARRTASGPRCSARARRRRDAGAGDLVLKGYGDPTPRARDLARLAAPAARRAGSAASAATSLGDESLVRHAPDRARLDAGFYIDRVAAALGARGRPRPRTGAARRRDPALAAARALRPHPQRARESTCAGAPRGRARPRTRSRSPRPSREPLADVAPLHGPRERQLHRRDRAEGDRREVAGKGTTAAGAEVVRRGARGGGDPARRRADRRRLRALAPRPADRARARRDPARGLARPRAAAGPLGLARRRRRSGTLEQPQAQPGARRRAREDRHDLDASALPASSATASPSSVVQNGRRSRRPARASTRQGCLSPGRSSPAPLHEQPATRGLVEDRTPAFSRLRELRARALRRRRRRSSSSRRSRRPSRLRLERRFRLLARPALERPVITYGEPVSGPSPDARPRPASKRSPSSRSSPTRPVVLVGEPLGDRLGALGPDPSTSRISSWRASISASTSRSAARGSGRSPSRHRGC